MPRPDEPFQLDEESRSENIITDTMGIPFGRRLASCGLKH